MTYSFFGTCSNDYEQLFSCLETILNQSIIPKEIILVDSGHINIRVDITKMLNCKPIKLIYIRKNTLLDLIRDQDFLNNMLKML